MAEQTENKREVRSFVLRGGRTTPGQQKALDELMPEYGLGSSSDSSLDFKNEFGREAPVVLEIGFGNGESLAQMASGNPNLNYIGAEVHPPGVGRLLLLIKQQQLKNVRVFQGDAIPFLEQSIPQGSLDKICLFFPDPWPKKKHHKRRLLNAKFLELALSRLRVKGRFHFATDWNEYADSALEILDGCEKLENLAGKGQFSIDRDGRPVTKFEKRGKRLGHGVWDILTEKIKD